MSSFFEEENNFRIKGYFSLLGHSLTNFITGNILSFLQFLSYYSSYLTNQEIKTLKHSSRIFIALIITFSYLSNLFSIIITHKINIRTIIFIQYSLLMTSSLILYYTLNIYLIYLSFIILGIGIGISDYPFKINSIDFFPEKKDLLSFLNIIILSLSSPTFYLFLEKIISNSNGNFIKAIKEYLYYLIIIYIIFGIISITITFDYEYELFDESEFNETELSIMEESNYNLENINENDISIIDRKESNTSDYAKLRVRINNKKRKSSENKSKKTSNADIMFFANSLNNDNVSNFYLNLSQGIFNKNFWIISLFYFCSMIIIYNFFIKIKEKEIFKFLIFVSLFKNFLPFLVNLLGSKFISLITIFIQISLIILEQYYELDNNQKLFCTIGQAFSYVIFTINIYNIFPQKYPPITILILSNFIFCFGCISLWLNIFVRINKFKEPDMEFTILLILCFLSIFFLLMIKGPFILFCGSKKTNKEKLYESSSEEELKEKIKE